MSSDKRTNAQIWTDGMMHSTLDRNAILLKIVESPSLFNQNVEVNFESIAKFPTLSQMNYYLINLGT